jgi:hypothetical protein
MDHMKLNTRCETDFRYKHRRNILDLRLSKSFNLMPKRKKGNINTLDFINIKIFAVKMLRRLLRR